MQKLFFLALLFSHTLFAQDTALVKHYPQDYFSAPLSLTPALAGTFGEIRANHFHSGLDYRTNQRQGYPVYAAADGYISRMRVQIGGGGNILYINHPNGYTTVYMHLQKFNPQIFQYLRDYQYRKQQYDVDFPLLPVEIPVKKGEIIAWSGATGAVAGPHLHFEIRDTRTEMTINPQLFGYQIPDNVKPLINGLYLYELGDMPFDENTPRKAIPVTGTNGNYYGNEAAPIKINGDTGFGVITSDQNIPGGSKNGVYSIELCLDDKPVYLSTQEGFYFTNSRAVNSHIDYPLFLSSGKVVQKSFVEPGNPLTIYKTLVNRGIILLSDNQIHQLEYTVKDVKGNTSTLSFKAIFSDEIKRIEKMIPAVSIFKYARDNEYHADGINVKIPKGVLYSNLNFTYSVSPKPIQGFSKIHHIHNRLTPLHDVYSIELKPDSSLRSDLYNKTIIVNTSGVSQGGFMENGYVKTFIKTFGSFYIRVDTVPPVIRPINITNEKSMIGATKLITRIADNLSGIKTYKGFIDGKWVLMEYDYKSGNLWHTFDERTAAGKHSFKLVVTDAKDNTTTFDATFYR